MSVNKEDLHRSDKWKNVNSSGKASGGSKKQTKERILLRLYEKHMQVIIMVMSHYQMKY